MGAFPDVDTLWAAYPLDDAPSLGVRLGGAVGDAWRIPFGHAFRVPGTPATLSTLRGGDDLRYAFRLPELEKYLRELLGEPGVKLKRTRGEPSVPAAFRGRQGIICFADGGWPDATGHLDLWDGGSCRQQAFWGDARRVVPWTAVSPFSVRSALGGQLRVDRTPVVTIGRPGTGTGPPTSRKPPCPTPAPPEPLRSRTASASTTSRARRARRSARWSATAT